MGSPSESDLQRGDAILQIQGRDSADLTHMDAHDLIKAAGQRLQLLIRRMPGAPQTPTSPLPSSEMHPYAKLLRETEASRPALFQPMHAHRPQPTTHRPTTPKPYCFSPLPTTPVTGGPLGGFFTPSPRNQADVELMEYRQEKYKEKDAMLNQGYRTLPLIAPGPKTRHDIPMGSYLRHVPDSNWKGGRTTSVQPTTPKFYGHYPTPTYSTIGRCSGTRRAPSGPPPGAPTFERPIDDSSVLVHHQFNSPMFLYSQKNIDQTIREQTGISNAKPKLTVGTGGQAPNQGPLSPGTSGSTLAPARPGTKLSNIVDITLSPTFQLIQEAENRSGSPVPDSGPRTPTQQRRVVPGPGPRTPFYEENSFGSNREIIHQSGSFKTLMSAMRSPFVAASE
ncbi:hypothetical protein JTE90_028016 [Oedothorax gibbosus]|uniref:PDZ domain-containing protein n=1 Tax=Oedothorax gibbosus TaxID=931172 RepID=A0AAV6VF95_9ARAC|nr:hypothetical protein JTE90_028016 [Oedothorax gibbosus]